MPIAVSYTINCVFLRYIYSLVMPNWIRTTIEITGDREVLEKIYSAVNDCLDMPEILEDGSTNSWVGHVFDSLGINTKKIRS